MFSNANVPTALVNLTFSSTLVFTFAIAAALLEMSSVFLFTCKPNTLTFSLFSNANVPTALVNFTFSSTLAFTFAIAAALLEMLVALTLTCSFTLLTSAPTFCKFLIASVFLPT